MWIYKVVVVDILGSSKYTFYINLKNVHNGLQFCFKTHFDLLKSRVERMFQGPHLRVQASVCHSYCGSCPSDR